MVVELSLGGLGRIKENIQPKKLSLDRQTSPKISLMGKENNKKIQLIWSVWDPGVPAGDESV